MWMCPCDSGSVVSAAPCASFTNRPSIYTCLLAKQLPDIGGNTTFANMYMAYDSLSPAFQRMIGAFIPTVSATATLRSSGCPVYGLTRLSFASVRPNVRVVGSVLLGLPLM